MRNLIFVVYDSESDNGITETISRPDNVSYDGRNWWYHGRRLLGPFEIGVGVRVPESSEDREFYDTMMVLEEGNPDHRANLARALNELYHPANAAKVAG